MRRADHVLLRLPNGTFTRIAIDDGDPFDLDEAKEFEQAAMYQGHANVLAMLSDLRRQGLSPGQATGVVCEYMDMLKLMKEQEEKI